MKKTAAFGTMFPRAKLRLNNSSGTSLCTATGSTALTTTLVKYTLSCTTTANITMTTATRFYLWTGVNLTVGDSANTFKAELDVEGATDGNYDSKVTIPLPIPTPSITSVSPTSGPQTTVVTITGTNFGATQGTSTVKFNGVTATPTSWSDTSITAPVPAGAFTGDVGNVVVTKQGIASNGSSFTVTNAPPSVSISSPSNNASFTAGANITITADASDIDGGVFGVSFYQGSTLLGSDTTSPYSFTWNNVAGGNYTLTAQATDFQNTTTSTPINIRVNSVPTAQITGPLNNSAFIVNDTIIINANAADSDGTISKVEFYQGAVKLGEDSSAPFSFAWNSVGEGSYIVTAKSIDNDGAIGVSTTVNIRVNSPSISGRITKVNTTNPVVGATVKIRQSGTLLDSATTNATGDFVVGGLAAGTYQVEATAGGYISQTKNYVAVTGGSVTIVNFELELDGGAVSYTYDEVGRLKSVTDQSGETALYSYDETGNLTDITRQNSATPGIFSVSPNFGEVSSFVTIYGTGFSPTPSQNTVKFNGITAVVTSVTSTQIATSVPVGASTGLITVTTPGGTATSTAPFAVGQPGAPTITTFTPNIGSTGNTINITGTNFDINAINNSVAFNGARATVTSASATSLTVNVPSGGTTGRISMTTSSGRAVSSDEFFIPPSPYTGGDVASASRINFGETKTVSIPTADKIAMLVFDGAVNQRVGLNITGLTISGSTNIKIYRPDGAELPGKSLYHGETWFIEIKALPVTGTYIVIVDPVTTGTGNATLRLNAIPPDVTGTIAIGGSTVPVNITESGQNARLSFNGTAGQIISLEFSGTTTTTLTDVSIFDSNGTRLAANYINRTNPTFYFGSKKLPANGTYTILIDPALAGTGGTTVKLVDASDISTTMTPGGSAYNATIAQPGQRLKATFAGTAGQRVALVVSGVTIIGKTYASIQSPDNSFLLAPTMVTNRTGIFGEEPVQSGFIEPVTLPVTGTYTIDFYMSDGKTGNATLQLYDVPSDTSVNVAVNDPPVTVTNTAPGQNSRVTFNGIFKQRVIVNLTGNVSNEIPVKLLIPNGTTLANTTFYSTGLIDVQSLPITGVYTVLVDPSGTATVSTTVRVREAETNAGTITAGGAAVNLTSTVPGELLKLTFVGTAGQRVSFNLTGATFALSNITIYNPDQKVLVSKGFSSTNSGYIDAQTLLLTGTYSIVIDAAGLSSGSATAQLYNVPADAVDTLEIDGAAKTVTTSVYGQNARYSFTATAGQITTVRVTGNTMNTAEVGLLSPYGTVLASTTSSSAAFDLSQQTLPVAGTYTVLVNPSNTNTGSITVNLTNNGTGTPGVADIQTTITANGSPVMVTTTQPQQNARLTFSGVYGQRVSISFSGNTIPNYTSVSLINPDGSAFSLAGLSQNGTYYFDTHTLPASGTYTILIDPITANVGNITVQLINVVDVDAGTITVGAAPLLVSTTQPGQNARLTFNGTAGQRVSLNLSGSTFPGSPSTYINLLNPDGSNLGGTSFYQSNNGFLDTQVLPATGTYAILVDPPQSITGSVSVKLNDATDANTNNISIGSSPVTVNITQPGQSARLSFNAAYGQRVSLSASDSTIAGTTSISLLKPDGTELSHLSNSTILTGGTGFIDNHLLPVPGDYTIVVNPQAENTGSVTIKLNDAGFSEAGSISIGGPPVTVTTTQPGQNVRLIFNGTVGQRVSLSATNITFGGCYTTVYSPDQSIPLTEGNLCSAASFIEPFLLPSSAVYTVLLDVYNNNTGSANLQLHSVPADLTGSVTVNGSSVATSTTAPGQNAALTFSGAANRQVTVYLTNNTMNGVKVSLLKPDGTELTYLTSSAPSFNLPMFTLPESGIYTIKVDPSNANTGSISVNITNP